MTFILQLAIVEELVKHKKNLPPLSVMGGLAIDMLNDD